MRQPDQPSRRLMIIATIVAGLFVALGYGVAVYASMHALDVDVPIIKDGIVVRRQSKEAILFGPLLMQFLFFIVMIYYCIIWKRFVRRGLEKITAYNEQYSMQVDMARLLRFVCYGVMGFYAVTFMVIVYYSIQLLSV